MFALPSRGPIGRRILTPYVLIWITAAGVAAGYLALFGMQPNIFAQPAQVGPDIEQKLTQAKREMQRGLADLDPIRRTVGEIKMDVANLKIAVQEAARRDASIMERVAALDGSEPPTPQVVSEASEASEVGESAAAPASPPPTPRQNPRNSVRVTPPEKGAPTTVAPLSQAPTQAQAKVLNGSKKPANAIETGSIARAAKAARKAPVAKRPPVGLILATGPSVDTLRLNWSILTDRHADTVRNLHPRYVVRGKGSARSYSLVAGPVASTAQARKLCKAMAAKGVVCKVSTYRGNAL